MFNFTDSGNGILMDYKDQLIRKSMNDPDDINEFSPRYKEGECVQPALVKICLERLI